MTSYDDELHRLDTAGRLAARWSRSPRFPVYGVLAAAMLLSWSVLIAAAISLGSVPGAIGPGEVLLQGTPDLPLPAWAQSILALCLGPVAAPAGLFVAFAVLVPMWFLMSVAMMLPSAAPMVRTYCEIADTAVVKGERAVHPLVLVGGYLIVWMAASVLFALLTVAVQSVAASVAFGKATLFGASLALAVAGIYQFSGLKEACLKKCRNPFGTLFSRWSTKPSRIFRLGLEQGVWCLGCCWALMLVMFAVGLMNVFWMALIGLFTIVEKQLAGSLASRIAGAILLVWSAALLVLSI